MSVIIGPCRLGVGGKAREQILTSFHFLAVLSLQTA